MVRRRVLAIAALASLAAAVAVELVVRATREPPVYIGLLPFDPELGYRMPPSFQGAAYDERGTSVYRLSSLGFRGPELPAPGEPKPAERTRVLFVGDSFLTPTVRDEDLVQSACVSALGERGIAADAYTLCCNDYGTAQELMLFERHGERVRPDAVVLVVYPANDVAGNSVELAGRVETCAGDYLRPYLVPHGEAFEVTWAQPARAFLRRHLRSFALLDRALIARAKEGGLFAWYAPWPLDLPRTAERLRAGLSPAEWLEVFREHDPEHPWERAWRVTEELLLAFAARARELGARFLVLVVPATRQAEINSFTYCSDLWTERFGGGARLAQLDMDLPDRRLAALGRRTGIEVRLLLEPLRAAARAGTASYMSDGHLNGRGGALAGAVVADWIAGGDGFASAGIDAHFTSAASLLPPAESAPRRLDLDDERARLLLVDGWNPYLEPGTGRLAWAASPVARVLLPVRRGDRVVVSGWLPPHAEPTTLGVEGAGASAKRKLAPGVSFEAELEAGANAELPGPLTPLELRFSGSFRPAPDEWRRFGAYVTSIELR
jgi:hypothetical protein